MRRISVIIAVVLFCSAVTQAQNNPGPELRGQWYGNLHSEMSTTFTAGPGGSCTGEAWDFDLSLFVNPDGRVFGDAVGDLASPPKCSFTTTGPEGQAIRRTADVSGKFDGKQFELQFKRTMNGGATFGIDTLVDFPGAEQKIVVPVISPGIAQGETATARTASTGVGTGQHKLMLKRDCGPPPYDIREPVLSKRPDFPHAPGNIAPCEKCSGIWTLIDARETYTSHLLQTGCTYVYEATWQCPTTGDIKHARQVKTVSLACIPTNER